MITSLGEEGACYCTVCPCFVVTGHRIFLISYDSGIVITSLGEGGAGYSTVCPCFVVTGHRSFLISYGSGIVVTSLQEKRELVTVLCDHVLWSQATEHFLISNGFGIVITSLQEEGSCYSTVCPCFVVTGHRIFLISYDSGIVITSLGEGGAGYSTVCPCFVVTGHRSFLISYGSGIVVTSLQEKRELVTVLCDHVLWSQATEHFLISNGSGIVITSLQEEGSCYSTVCPCFMVTGHRTFSHIWWFWHCDHVTTGRGSLLQYCVPMFFWSQAIEHFLISYGSGIVITSLQEEGACCSTVCPCFLVTGRRTFSHILRFWHCDHVFMGTVSWLQYCVPMFCGFTSHPGHVRWWLWH